MADVRVDVSLDTKQAEQDAASFKSKISGVFGDMGKIAGGVFMAQVGGQLASKGVETFKNSINLARDLGEIQSKSNTIFGESAAVINAWASSASTGFGQSKAQALDAASTFGNMFSQLGLGSDVTADMSQKMTELASDFASFHNADITEVLNAQQAAFRGEYDAVQRFVPTINAAAVEMKALEQTGKASTKELTAQEKAVAAYTLMMEGAGKAAGDFDRTQGSLANQQRVLSAQWQDFQAQLGQALIPALTAVVTAINTQVIPAVKDFATKAKGYWESDLKPAFENLQKAWEKIDGVVVPIIQIILDEWKTLAENFALTVGIIVDLIEGDWRGAWEKFKEIIQNTWDFVTDSFGRLKDAFGELLPILGDAAKAIGQGIFNGIKEGLGDLWQLGADIVHWVLQGLKDMAWQLWDWAAEMARGLADKLNPANIIGSVTGGIADVGRGVFDLTGAGGGGGGGGGGAAPFGTVWDQSANAYVAPWEVGNNLPNRIFDWMKSPGFGFTGRPITVNIGTVNARDEAEARSAAGTIAYTLATAGMVA